MLCRSAPTRVYVKGCTVEPRLLSTAEARTRGAATTTARPRRHRLLRETARLDPPPSSRRRRPGEDRSDAVAAARRAYRDGVDRHAIAPRPSARDDCGLSLPETELGTYSTYSDNVVKDADDPHRVDSNPIVDHAAGSEGDLDDVDIAPGGGDEY